MPSKYLFLLLLISSCQSTPNFNSMGEIQTIKVYCFWCNVVSSHGFNEEQIRGYPRGEITDSGQTQTILEGLKKVAKGRSADKNQDLSLILDLIGSQDSLSVHIGANFWVDFSGVVYQSNLESLQPIYDLLPPAAALDLSLILTR